MMAGLTPEQLESEVLSDPSCPWSVIGNVRSERAMSVRFLRRFAETRGLDADAVEATMDEYINQHGGKRQRVTRLSKVLSNLARRATGKLPESDDAWIVRKADLPPELAGPN
jgi:hypothetical protein